MELPTPVDDGLYTPSVGEWSKKKHYYLSNYIDAFTNSMKGKKWKGLHYIDLFAGAGIERIEQTKELEWGSPLIAAQAKYSFTQLHLCERNLRKFKALQTRVKKYRSDSIFVNGDANSVITEVLKKIPPGSLSLAFLDPYGLHLNFTTVQLLSTIRADLVIFFPDYLDMCRNHEKIYHQNPESNMDLFLGVNSNWRSAINQPRPRSEIFREVYFEQLKKIGFTTGSRIHLTLSK